MAINEESAHEEIHAKLAFKTYITGLIDTCITLCLIKTS